MKQLALKAIQTVMEQDYTKEVLCYTLQYLSKNPNTILLEKEEDIKGFLNHMVQQEQHVRTREPRYSYTKRRVYRKKSI